MNTGKQINAMVALVFVLVVLTGAYALVDPIRAERQEEFQLEESVGRGAKLFANNCRSCHANDGTGILAGPGYPGVPLNVESYRDPEQREELEQRLFDTISCGRYNTLMPPWSQEHGGPLNDEQIRQLVLLITTNAGDGWAKAEELANQLDEEFGKIEAPDPSDPENLTKGTCGSPASVPAPGGGGQQPPATETPSEGEQPPDGGAAEAKTEWEVVAGDNFFDLDTITVPVGGNITVTLKNEGQVPHNISFYLEDGGDEIQTGDLIQGGEETTVEFTAPTEPGEYFFRCDVHPQQMRGTLVVAE